MPCPVALQGLWLVFSFTSGCYKPTSSQIPPHHPPEWGDLLRPALLICQPPCSVRAWPGSLSGHASTRAVWGDPRVGHGAEVVEGQEGMEGGRETGEAGHKIRTTE